LWGSLLIFFWNGSASLGLRCSSTQPLRSPIKPTSGINFLQAVLQPSRGKFSSMESLISHFRLTSEGWPTTPGFVYRGIDSPKGEVGVTLVSTGGSKPSRLKLRTPVSHNMHLIPTISVGSIFADFVATFCSLDIVLGEIDR
jgi:NADH-quinone oxidoreductase subunit D